MEFINLLTTDSWVKIIFIIVVLFFVLSLLRTLVKSLMVLTIIVVTSSIILNIVPEGIVETGLNSTKISQQFIEEKMKPLFNEGYMERFLKEGELSEWWGNFLSINEKITR